MYTKNKLADTIFFIIMGILYSFSVASAFFSASALSISDRVLILFSAMFVLIFSIIIFNKYTVFTFLGFLCLMVGAILVIEFNKNIELEWFENFKVLLKDMYLFANRKIPYREDFDIPSAFVVTLFIAFFTVLCTQAHFTFLAMSFFAIAIFFMPTTSGNDKLSVAFFIIVFCLIVFLIKRMNMYAEGKPTEDDVPEPRYVNTFMALFFGILIFASAWYLPKPHIESIDIVSTIRNTDFRQLGQQILEKMNVKNLQMINFSNKRGDLGGPIKLNNDVVMTVTADSSTFLAGKVFDTYTGRGWVVDDTDKEVVERQVEGGYSVEGYVYRNINTISGEGWRMSYGTRDVNRLNKITINMGDNRTKTIFTPPSPNQFFYDAQNDKFVLQVDDMGQFTSKSMLPAGAEYTFAYAPYKSLEYSFDLDLIPENSDVFENYLQLPDDVPQRVYDLAKEVTANKSTSAEKIMALKDYLTMFPYTLSPGKVPEGSDLVDHFLFAEQKGYCVYYASSLAVMGRAIGIPTRYVEGYVMPRISNDDGTYTVTNKQAHAWVEVFVSSPSHIGWHPVDATAPEYSFLGDSVVISHGDGSGGVAEEILAPRTQQEYQNSVNSQQNASSTPSEPSSSQSEHSTEETENISTPTNRQNVVKGQDKKNNDVVLFMKILAVVTILVLSVVLIIYRKQVSYHVNKAKIKKYTTQPPKIAANNIFAGIVKRASRMGYPMKRNETSHVYAKRVNKYLSFDDIQMDMQQVELVFSKASYSPLEVTKGDIDSLTKYFFKLLSVEEKN